MAENVTSIRSYLLVFFALLILTVVTVAAAFQDFGAWNDVVALSIAVLKAVLVVLFFMHVYHSSRLSKLVVVSGFVWLLILIGLTMSDFFSRGFILGAGS